MIQLQFGSVVQIKVTVEVAPYLRVSVLASDSESDLEVELKIDFSRP